MDRSRSMPLQNYRRLVVYHHRLSIQPGVEHCDTLNVIFTCSLLGRAGDREKSRQADEIFSYKIYEYILPLVNRFTEDTY